MFRRSLTVALLLLLSATGLPAMALTDNFDSGASALWGNQVGAWTAAGGVYSASSPSNFPNAHSSLPLNLTDLILDVDINDVHDGGVWVRSAPAGGSIGRDGVLLVTGGGGSGFSGLYWHVVSGGDYGGPLNGANGLFGDLSDIQLRVTAFGNVYSAYLNGSATPATVLVDNTYTSGEVALYDFSVQTFDNFSVVPEPAMLGVLGIAGAFASRRPSAQRHSRTNPWSR